MEERGRADRNIEKKTKPPASALDFCEALKSTAFGHAWLALRRNKFAPAFFI